MREKEKEKDKDKESEKERDDRLTHVDTHALFRRGEVTEDGCVADHVLEGLAHVAVLLKMREKVNKITRS